MSLFGRVDQDLQLLHLSPAVLKQGLDTSAICIGAFDEQVNHHCIRLAWREHARSGVPVRDLLKLIAAALYVRITETMPYEDADLDDEENAEFNDEESILIRVDEALHQYEFSCLGFFILDEFKALCEAGLDPSATYPPVNSIFERVTRISSGMEHKPKSRLEFVYAQLLTLQDYWQRYRDKVASSPIHRETVRIVEEVTGRDPMLAGRNDTIAYHLYMVGTLAQEESGASIRRRAPMG